MDVLKVLGIVIATIVGTLGALWAYIFKNYNK